MEVKWYWVKAHVNVTCNETSDSLATAGAGLVGYNVHVELPPSFLKYHLGQKNENLSTSVEVGDQKPMRLSDTT